MVNFTTVACRISSRLKWYKNYKNRLRLAKVIVKNKMSRFYGSLCILYYIVLCCVVLYYMMLHRIILYYIMLCYVMLYCIMLYYVMSCYIILYYIILCYITSHYITLYPVINKIVWVYLWVCIHARPRPPRKRVAWWHAVSNWLSASCSSLSGSSKGPTVWTACFNCRCIKLYDAATFSSGVAPSVSCSSSLSCPTRIDTITGTLLLPRHATVTVLAPAVTWRHVSSDAACPGCTHHYLLLCLRRWQRHCWTH